MTQICLVNLFHLDPPRNGGTARVAREICQMLAGYAQMGQAQVIFAVGWRFAQEFPTWLEDDRVEVIPVLPEIGLTSLFRSLQPDLLISPLYGMAPFVYPHDLPDVPYVVSVPDVLLLYNPKLLSTAEVRHRQELYGQLPYAFRVVVQSEHSRQYFMRHLALAPERVKVVPLAGDCFDQSAGASPIVPLPYLFYPANGWPHKRHDLLLQIMKEVWSRRPDFNLVLTGWREPGFISHLARRFGCPENRIIDLGYVSDSQMAALYRHAESLLFVSEYEGFGMPLLEAMANDCPVVCAPLTSIPEVVGDAGLYVNSIDPKDWAEAILTELPAQRARLIEQGRLRAGMFSWERFRQQWTEILIEAGLRLSPSSHQQDFASSQLQNWPDQPQNEPTLPLNVVRQELAVWAAHYTTQQADLEAKEKVIQSLSEQLQGIDLKRK